jgi:CBS domain containing-hemolysin-like protein
MPELLYIVAVILMSGFFSGSEMAFVTANKLKMEIESRKDTFRGRSIAYFSEHPENFLTTTLVGNNFINVLYATLMAIFLTRPVQHLYLNMTGSEPTTAMLLFLQTLIASVIILLFGEILAKAIFRVQADFFVTLIAVPLRLLNLLMSPLIFVTNRLSGMLLKLFGSIDDQTGQVFRREDVEMIFRELRESGGSTDIDQEDSELLHNVLELSNKRVKETMIPRTEIVAVDRSASLEDLMKAFIESGYSKIPVYQDTIDDIIGVVFAYDMFNNPESISNITRPVKLIPSSKKSKDLLTEFRQTNTSVAIVIDEYGGTAGMITIEDLIEEVVGDIQDEYDKEHNLIKKIAPNTYMLAGSVELDELNEVHPELELQDENGTFETVAGYIIHHTGRIPKVNEELQIEGNTFIITKATQSKLETIKLILR